VDCLSDGTLINPGKCFDRSDLGDLSESFGTATWLKNIVRRAFDYSLTLLREGTRLKSVVLKEHLIIPD
jgi:hypothetical protein